LRTEDKGMDKLRFDKNHYLTFNPFEGERDVDIRCRSVKLVTVRKAHPCAMAGTDKHQIQPGDTARVEKAIVEGKWAAFYSCVKCMEGWFEEIGLYPEMPPYNGNSQRNNP